MACLSLGLRFPLHPARRAWRIFTSKLQKKLPKFRKSKPTYKTRNHRRILGAGAGSGTFGTGTSALLQQHKVRKKAIWHVQQRPYSSNPPRRFVFKKRHAPVFVDKLYKEACVVGDVAEPHPLPGSSIMLINFVDRSVPAPGGGGTSVSVAPPGGPGKKSANSTADDMWESVAMASPQMHKIDERAEEFIAKFRLDMELQEAMARAREL